MFAAEKAVIASDDLGGMTELVKDGERGLLVPPGDVDALANAMKWMDAYSLETQEMGKKARAYASEIHSSAAHYKRLMGIYKSVMEINDV